MKTNTDLKIDKNTVIHVPTKKIANKVNKLLDNLGATWCSGIKYTEIDNWNNYGVKTCYNVHNGCFGRVRFYIEEGFNIISAADFIKLHKKSIF